MDQSVRNDNQASSRPVHQLDLHSVALVALLGLEALLFYSQVAGQIAPFYPRNFDQASFYSETYDLLAGFRERGWVAFLEEIAGFRRAGGMTFVIQGGIMGALAGYSRTAVLSLNLVYFIALQLTIFITIRARTPDVLLAWIAIGLLLLCRTLFQIAGGIYDYRIDFAAFCLYGIWMCLVLRSGTFRDTRRSLVVGLVAAFLVALRYFVVIYIAGICAGLLIVVLLGASKAASPFARGLRACRARNILISSGVTAGIVLPFLIPSWTAIYNYYVVGHILNEEKHIRADELHIHSLLDHILWYPRSVLADHVGWRTLLTGAAVAVAAALAAIALDRVSHRDLARRLARRRLEFLAIALAIMVPLALLTLDISKSPVVGGIVVVPVVLGIMLVCAACWPRSWPPPAIRDPAAAPLVPSSRLLPRLKAHIASLAPRRARAVACAIVLAFGTATFATRGATKQHVLERPELERVASINREIARYVLSRGGKATVSYDRVMDYLNRGTTRIESFERFGESIQLQPAFGHGPYGIFATPRDVALKLIAESDVIVLTDPTTGRFQPYPMNTKIREYWDEMAAWTKENRALLYSTQIAGVPHNVFAKAPVAIAGASAGWIVSTGILIEAAAAHLARWPLVVLSGEANYGALGGPPRPRAILVDAAGKPGRELAADLKPAGRRYEITIDTRTAALPSVGPVRIRLTFDRSFVPARLGINPDPRELVVMAPVERELRASPAN